MKWLIPRALLAIAACCFSARAQDAKEPPTPQHKALDALAGKWTAAIKFKTGPEAFEEGKADVVAEWILDGRVLQQTYKSNFNGQPFTVIQFLGYDENKKTFFEIKFDSMDTGAMHNEGTLSDDGKTLSFKGQRVLPGSEKPSSIRTMYTFTDKDHFTLDWFMPGEDGKEEKAVSLVHTRK